MREDARILLVTPRFRVEEYTVRDHTGESRRRTVVRHPGAVAVIPLLGNDRVCLIRNRRPTVGQALVEIPAGTRDPGETPEQTAWRELLEETGYRAGRLWPLCAFFTSPGVLDEEMHVFVAEELVFDKKDLDPGEEIENLPVSWDEAMEMVVQGIIRDAKTLTALLLYDRQRRP